jgi:hypothetical protein
VTMGALLACAVACANGETTDIGEGLEGGDDGPDEASTNEGGAEDTGQTILDTGSHDTSSSDLGSASDVPSSTDAAEEMEMETGTTGDAGGCSLTSMTACASAAACCPMNGTTECVCQAGTATQGQACSSTVACAPGYVCVTKQGATSSSCSAWCAEPAGTCPSASTCTQLSPPTVIGGVTYGACL